MDGLKAVLRTYWMVRTRRGGQVCVDWSSCSLAGMRKARLAQVWGGGLVVGLKTPTWTRTLGLVNVDSKFASDFNFVLNLA